MRRIGFVVFPGFQILDLAAVAVFEMANTLTEAKAYELRLLSEHGGAVASSAGVDVATRSFARVRCDTLLVTGGLEVEPAAPGLLQFLRRAQGRTRRIASICTGAFILAEAGLLNGRNATTHWFHARELQRLHTAIKVQEDRIFINDGNLWTSAGMTACIDLALALVEQDLGIDIARSVAKKMVVHHRRGGGQSQFSPLLELETRSDRIQQVLSYAKNHLHTPLPVERLAEVAHLSPRQFTRAFTLETGKSPAKAIEVLRVEVARELIEQGHAIEVVATKTGFANPERMRRSFIRAFGQPPQSVRRAAKLREAG